MSSANINITVIEQINEIKAVSIKALIKSQFDLAGLKCQKEVIVKDILLLRPYSTNNVCSQLAFKQKQRKKEKHAIPAKL